MVQAIGAGAYLFARELGELYALSVVFGIAYGGVMPLYAILARDYFGPHIMGTVFGAISTMASLGMALRTLGRRLGVRHLCELLVALYRLVHRRPRGRRRGVHLQAGADRKQAHCIGVIAAPRLHCRQRR